ncbi:MAG: methyltransferase domain-containing protein [Pseudonocardiaceae bacterium]
MLTDVTELRPQERETARFRLRELADQFTVDGTLRTAQWQAVYRRTWRHPYVPSYYPELGAGPLVSAADEQQRARWLAAVYSNESLITKVIQVPSRQGGSYPRFTSSSTLPSLLLIMLEALDVIDGCRVLEIGTGSGYHAALLCERLGSEYVTSVDIDPELVELARERLAANGYTPTLAAADGADGYPPGAPYDRIIATCSVPAIPPAWLTQAAPGAIIMADVRGPLGGTVVRLRMNDDGVATGRFLPGYASFMPLRPDVDTFPSPPPRLTLADGAVDSVSDVDPKLLRWDTHVGFVMQWHLPEVTWRHTYAQDGDVGLQLEAPDGSGAQAWHTPENGGFLVRQSGPRRLWDRVENAHEFWRHAGRPNYDRFGITAHGTEQYVWYDHPDSPHRWQLPTPTGPRTTQPVG